MAETITGINIKKLVEESSIIENGSVDNCGPLKYDFTLSDEILKSDFSAPVKLADLSVEERREALIQPGEVVYVLTKEKVNLPSDMYMSLSANRGMSEYGVLTLGGFAVDPGYSGRLMFGLYNYSSTPFTIMPGAKLIGGVFYQLDENESVSIKNLEVPKAIEDFPTRLISIISKYSPTGLTSLEESINTINKQINAIKDEINSNKDEIFGLRHLVKETQEQTNQTSKAVKEISDNINELTGSVKDLKTDVENLKSSLEIEADLRKKMSEDLDKKIEIASVDVDKKLIFIKGATWTLSAAVMILITLLTCWANGWLKFGG